MSTTPAQGPVAVLAQSDAIQRLVLRHLDGLGWGASFAATCEDEEAWASALDAAARHPDVGAILLAAPSWAQPMALAPAIDAILPHVPIAAALTGPGTLLGEWLTSRGVDVVRGFQPAVEESLVLALTAPPAGDALAIIAQDTQVAAWLSEDAAAHGWEVHVETGDPTAVHRLAGSGRFDAIVAFADGRPAPRSLGASQDTGVAPVLWLAGKLSTPFGSSGELRASPAAALRWLRGWGEPSAPGPRATLRDVARTRQLLQALERGQQDPDAAAHWASALGLAAAPSRRVRYVEDALIVAAELGYPIRLGVVSPDAAPEGWPDDVRVLDSATLLDQADGLLAAARRAGHPGAWLTVDPWLQAPTWIIAHRDATWGTFLTLRTRDEEERLLAPLRRPLASPCRSAPRAAALLLAAMDALPRIARLAIRMAPGAVDDAVDRVYIELHDEHRTHRSA